MCSSDLAFRGAGEFENDLDDVIDILHATSPLDPSRPVLVAGDPEAAERERRLNRAFRFRKGSTNTFGIFAGAAAPSMC